MKEIIQMLVLFQGGLIKKLDSMFAVIIFHVIQAWQLDLVTAHFEIAVILSV